MIKPRKYGTYIGFMEEEVQTLCRDHDVDFGRMKQWYDGYSFRGVKSIYNPNSVMKAIRNDDFDSYWTQTSAAESLMKYISLDFDGLSKTVAELIGGISVEVDTRGFENDLVTFRNRDDVLTLLIHLGYLAYDEETQTVHVPNEEVRREFARSIRAVIKLAYFSYRDHYLKFEELPAGTAEGAIAQIKNKQYPDAIKGLGCDVLLVGINYDKDAPAGKRKHECVIERLHF